MKLAILDDYQDVALASADWGSLAGVEVTVFGDPFGSEDEAAARLAPFDILCLMRERTPFPRSLIERLPKLKLISLTGTRAPSLDSRFAASRGIVVCNTRGGGGSGGTAELAWGLILGASRHLAAAHRSVREGGWQRGLPSGSTLGGKRLGVIGLGSIGARVARAGLAFDMDVVAWSANLTDEKAAAAGVKRVAKEELLATSDVVSLHLVLSDRSRGTLGAAELARMKQGALLVNTSRGPLVDEAALVAALEAGRIRAALDVFDREPLPAGHPLRRLPNVTLAPHLGYVSEENYRVFHGDTVENVAAWLAGRPVRVMAS